MASKDELAAEVARLREEVGRLQEIIADLASAKESIRWYPYPSGSGWWYGPYGTTYWGPYPAPLPQPSVIYSTTAVTSSCMPPSAAISIGNVSGFELTDKGSFGSVSVSASGPAPVIIGGVTG